MLGNCPGLKSPRSESITTRMCPNCGGEVEFFSDDLEVKCQNCSHTLYNEVSNICVSWCQHALQCIADLRKRGLISQANAQQLEHKAKQTNPKLKS